MPTNVAPKARFTSASIVASERPKRLYTYFVSGSGMFPYDMLRYDSAWPATSEDAQKVHFDYTSAQSLNKRSIKLRSHSEPTPARWASFGWSVGTEKLY